MSEMGGLSINYSYLDMSSDELSASKGGMRKMHLYGMEQINRYTT